MTSGSGIFFDGVTSARQDVAVELGGSGLHITTPDGRTLADWPYAELKSLSAPGDVLRLGRSGSSMLARLDIHDPALAAAIDQRAANVDRSGSAARRQHMNVIAWSIAATVSLLFVAYYGVPALAGRLTPLVPIGIERHLGAAVDAQLRSMLDTRNAGAKFECGNANAEKPGRAALEKLVRRLGTTAALSAPLRVSVVRRPEANAIALPGAHIYVFQGLIAKAEHPDELAGVIAHELGHIANRDGTRSVLQAAGLSFLFGMLLGDFVGGGAVVVAARSVLQSSYSRDAEAAADLYGVGLMSKAGGDARALGSMLTKIGGATEPGMKILLDHPQTKARVATINAAAAARATAPLLDAAEWAAVKRICARS